MKRYKVEWVIDIEADSPREAAEKALEIQRRPDSIATVFNVFEGSEASEPDGQEYTIDLDEDEDEGEPTEGDQ